jgi:hypothetical protein
MSRNIPDNAILAGALQGIFRGNYNVFFTVDAGGSHHKVNVNNILRSLNLSSDTRARVFKTFPFPRLTYASDLMKARESAKGKPKGPAPVAKEEESEEKEEKKAETKRYQLVRTNSNKHGIYNALDATQVLFNTESNAKAYLHDLLHGYEVIHSYSRQPKRIEE